MPVSYRGRTYREGKKITWRDGLWALLMYCNIQSLSSFFKKPTLNSVKSTSGPDPTLDQHSQRRWKAIIHAAATTGFSKVVALFCLLAQVPIAVNHLGKEAFGLWMTLTSAVSLLGFADLGFGVGMQNKISEAYGKDDFATIRRIFVTGFRLLSMVCVICFCVFLIIAFGFDWASIFKVTDSETRELTRPALILVATAFCLGLPLASAQQLAIGLQLGWMQGAWLAVSSVLSLIFIALAASLKLKLIPFLAVALIPPVLINIALLFHINVRFKGDIVKTASFDKQIAREIMGTGSMFVVPQLGAAILFHAPTLVLSSILGAAAVTPFNLVQRLLNIVTQLQSSLLAPLWPTYAEAKARNHVDWIEKTFHTSLLITLAVTIPTCLLFAIFGEQLIFMWTKKPPPCLFLH